MEMLASYASGSWVAQLIGLIQVLFIDIALAGDNAIVVGLAVAGLEATHKRRAILYGIAGAAIIRIVLAVVALQLLTIIGLTLAGGILLLWVCWRMFRELRRIDPDMPGHIAPRKSLGQAIFQIVLADLSMSLDNILAVAGAAKGHLPTMIVGLAMSVILMGLAAGLLARLLERYRAIAWAGLLMVLYVALKMILEGSEQVVEVL